MSYPLTQFARRFWANAQQVRDEYSHPFLVWEAPAREHNEELWMGTQTGSPLLTPREGEPLVFPLQLTVLLSDPARDFSGGEFMLVEQRPRQQSRGAVVPLARGEAVIFPVHHRPLQGTRGFYRVTMRHGVSRVRDGLRMTLGVIFHDAA